MVSRQAPLCVQAEAHDSDRAGKGRVTAREAEQSLRKDPRIKGSRGQKLIMTT